MMVAVEVVRMSTKRMKKKTYWTRMDRCIACRHVGVQMRMCWMRLVVDADEYKEKRRKRKRKRKIYRVVGADGCGPKNADDLCWMWLVVNADKCKEREQTYLLVGDGRMH